MRDMPWVTVPNINETLRASLKRSGKNQSVAARLLKMAKTHMSDIILMKRRMTPEFAEDWCRLIEPRADNIMRRHLHYLGAAADQWDLTINDGIPDDHYVNRVAALRQRTSAPSK